MKDLRISTLAVEVYFSRGPVMLHLRPGRGSGWYGGCFASAGAYDTLEHGGLLNVSSYSRPGEIWIRAVSFKERLIP
jgi:hypothetical protein